MTDEAYVFHEDSKEKKRVARSAHKKPAHNSRRCRFPSDYKTRKELNAMNSEVKIYALSQPMKWKEFKALPEDLRKRYLIRLRDLYHAGPSAMAKMFGVSAASVQNMSRLLDVSYPNACRPAPKWASFLANGTPAREATPIKDLIPEDLRDKLDRYEQEHPQVKANVVDETAVPIIPEPAAQPGGYVLTDSDAMMLSNIHGILSIMSAGEKENPVLSKMFSNAADNIQQLVDAWMEVQG